MATSAGFPGHLEGIGVRNFIQRLVLKTTESCTSSSCAWRSPRALSGFLASTPQGGDYACVALGGATSRGSLHRSSCLGSGGRDHSTKKPMLQRSGGRSGRSRVTTCSGASNGASSFSSSNITPITLWESLKPSISYLTKAQLRMVKDALKLAFEAHDGQKRKSGEPFIIHPVEVSRILGELEMDWETIIAGLLHDTVEDTEHVTFERIEDQFGPAVRRIVEGETKVSKLGKMQCQNADTLAKDVKADDLRQMFLAMTEEVRVIIVKLADRLHNMRTLTHMPAHKQKYIAMETLQVFAPLAKLLGMYRIKSELEELSFMYAYPEEHAEIKGRVEALRKKQEDVVSEARKVLQETVSKDRFLGYMTADIKVTTRSKELYSIFKKVGDQKISGDEIRDIAQLRIVLKLKPSASVGQLCNVQQVCYHVMGLVHAMWPPLPQTMKDYIATPKPNGYQSLHTTVIPFGTQTYFPLEIQIRTEEMDKLAEWGIAAYHSGRWVAERESDAMGPFARKGGNGAASGYLASNTTGSCLNDADIARRVSWLKSIRDWQEEFVGNMSSREFVDTVTGDLLSSRVFVFTPKGEVKNLPKGATVIDYAYQIHTDVGNKMVAAKVNGKLVSPTHALANAEVVEIVTYDGVSTKKVFQLHRQWLQYAKTRSARHKLTKFLKEQATLSAEEITADTVNDFISDLEEDESDDESYSSDESPSHIATTNGKPLGTNNGHSFLRNAFQFELPSFIPKTNGAPTNGAALKVAEDLVSKIARGNGFAKFKVRYIQDEARAGIEAWQTDRIALWHSSGGGSVQWFCVCCYDRNSMLADVSAALVAAGIRIRACAAETDTVKGLGVMLFHIEGSVEDLVESCANVGSLEGMLEWSVGCSWQKPPHFLSWPSTQTLLSCWYPPTL